MARPLTSTVLRARCPSNLLSVCLTLHSLLLHCFEGSSVRPEHRRRTPAHIWQPTHSTPSWLALLQNSRLLVNAEALEEEIASNSGGIARFRGVTVKRSTNPYYEGVMHPNCYTGTLGGRPASNRLPEDPTVTCLLDVCASLHMSARAECSRLPTPVKETICLNFSIIHSNGNHNA